MRVNPLIASLIICASGLSLVPFIGNAQFVQGTIQGSSGTPGSIFYMQPNAPSLSVGVNSDAAMDTNNYNIYQKSNDVWSLQGNIKGGKGDKGDTGNTGVTGSQGNQGVAGNNGSNGSNGSNGTNGTTFQSATVTTDTAGLYTWTYPIPFGTGIVPQCWAQAQGPSPAGGVLVNIQNEGIATNTSRAFRVTKTNASVVALIGLTILSIPASVGATTIDIFCKAP